MPTTTPATAITGRIREACELTENAIILRKHLEHAYHIGALEDLLGPDDAISALVDGNDVVLSVAAVLHQSFRGYLASQPTPAGCLAIEHGTAGEDGYHAAVSMFPQCRADEVIAGRYRDGGESQ